MTIANITIMVQRSVRPSNGRRNFAIDMIALSSIVGILVAIVQLIRHIGLFIWHTIRRCAEVRKRGWRRRGQVGVVHGRLEPPLSHFVRRHGQCTIGIFQTRQSARNSARISKSIVSLVNYKSLVGNGVLSDQTAAFVVRFVHQVKRLFFNSA
ncbi:hypothetical protein BpHYR1_027251 [Brachionus plicatilis]|uniref:Uncharacterized protein n=1 Tax=Brachionus plicatilis TaxID=10195 RepID=A0A3M7P6A7_BRAPC|nr:hypothetical protein BpHYR1_027251 [Brachionus plicatilis]